MKMPKLEPTTTPWSLISGAVAVSIGLSAMMAMLFWHKPEDEYSVVEKPSVPVIKEDPDMKPIRIRLVRQWDDRDPVILGTVIAKSKGRGQATRSIVDHWVNFQKEHPDSDDQFIDYLKKKGYEIPKKDIELDVVLD